MLTEQLLECLSNEFVAPSSKSAKMLPKPKWQEDENSHTEFSRFPEVEVALLVDNCGEDLGVPQIPNFPTDYLRSWWGEENGHAVQSHS